MLLHRTTLELSQSLEVFRSRFLGRGSDEALFSEKKGFQWRGGRDSVNEGFGKDFYRKGNSVKRSGPFSEPPDSENWKVADQIHFPKNQLLKKARKTFQNNKDLLCPYRTPKICGKEGKTQKKEFLTGTSKKKKQGKGGLGLERLHSVAKHGKSDHFPESNPKDPPVLKIVRRVNSVRGVKNATAVAKRYGECSEMFVSLGKEAGKRHRE